MAVVLGAAVLEGGAPSAALARRVLHAARLVRDGVAATLLLTGGVGDHPPSEAEVMRDLATAAGVDPSRIVLEPCAQTTMESAARCATIIAARRWRRVLLVTDRYHLRRALLAFRAYGVEASGSAPPEGRAGTSPGRWVLSHVREAAALPWYLLRLWLRRPPPRRPGGPSDQATPASPAGPGSG